MLGRGVRAPIAAGAVPSTPLRALLVASALVLCACGGRDRGPATDASAGADAGAPPDAAMDAGPPDGGSGPLRFHCAADETCPELLVAGDPIATLGGAPAPFRGYGDPSLERDPATGTLWLSYSWLDTIVVSAGPPPIAHFAVRTHLARSDDAGRTFTFVAALNDATRATSTSVPGQLGYVLHEVSTLARLPDGTWAEMWLDYFVPDGAERYGFELVRSTGATPERLGDAPEPWIRGSMTPHAPARYDLRGIAPGRTCVAFTEPALFADPSGTYLAANCLTGTSARDVLVLLRERTDGYDLVGVLLDGADAAALGGDRVEQADLSLTRDGRIALLVTPIRDGADPMHQGCVALEIDDLSRGHVARDAGGALRPLAVITSDGNGLGPGLCTYDAASETGVLLVQTDIDLAATPVKLVFSMRATGVRL